MITGRAINWFEAWCEIHAAYAKDPDVVIDERFASRAVSFDNIIFIEENDLGGLTHTLVGYSEYKLKLFDRNYIIPGFKETVGDKLVERIKADKKLSIISYPFDINNKAHDQGPCVINITIILKKKGGKWYISYRVNMRIGEITKRLCVDFIKFHELISYWNDRIKFAEPIFDGITFYSTALYAQSMFAVLAEHIPLMDVKFDGDHWFHKTVQQQYAKYDNPNFKMKMGKRIRRHLNKLKEVSNDK